MRLNSLSGAAAAMRHDIAAPTKLGCYSRDGSNPVRSNTSGVAASLLASVRKNCLHPEEARRRAAHGSSG